MASKEATRRRFIAYFASMGFGATALPEILWARMEQSESPKITLEMVKDALSTTGLPFTDEEANNLVNTTNNNLATFQRIHDFHIPLDVSPPYHFSALVPGVNPNRNREPFVLSKVSAPKKL